jgi:heat shock protein HtpX
VERIDYLDLIRKNRRSSWLLLFATFTLLTVVALGVNEYLGGGWIVAVIAVAVTFGLTWTSYLKSDQIALQSTRAVPADPIQFAQLHNLVESMALSAGMPKPAVYVVNDPAPNAFATGHNAAHATIAVTTGLLQKMSRDELEGVLAHELSHIKNEDMRVMTIAVATAGSIALITDIFWRLLFFGGGRRRSNDRDNGTNILAIVGLIFVLVLAPIAAAMLKASLSRKREAMADATAVQLTRYPTGLRRALEKLYADSTVVQHTSHATAHLWIEQPNETEPAADRPHQPAAIDGGPRAVHGGRAQRAGRPRPPLVDRASGGHPRLERSRASPRGTNPIVTRCSVSGG